jgi:Mg2+ and Co2+ transporter CorA
MGIFLLSSIGNLSAGTAIRSRKLTRVQAGQGKLKILALPKKNGRVDAKKILIESVYVKQDVVSRLTGKQKGELSVIINSVKRKQLDSAQKRFGAFVEGLNARKTAMDINELIMYVLRESYLETNKDLQFYAAKVKYFNELKKAAREHLAELRKVAVSIDDCSSEAKNSLAAYIKKVEDDLKGQGDDAQLANIDLQNQLQKQQQMVQMLSNVSKVLHDTAMAVIRKIG